MLLIPANNPEEYNKIVADMPYSSPLQSWGYGEARKVIGQTPMRFIIKRHGKTVGAVQILRKKLFNGVTTLYAPRGPALENHHLLPELKLAIQSIKKPSDIFFKIEPIAIDPNDEIPKNFGNFTRHSTEQPEHTLIADLSLDEKDLFNNLHSMARRNVRTAEKRGVVAQRDEDFEAFWEIFTSTNERAKLGAFPKAYYQTMLKECNKYGSESYIFLSRVNNKALAGGFFIGLGKNVCYLYGGSIKDNRLQDGAPVKDAKAPDAFYWHSILDAKQQGYKIYDFWGIPRDLSEDKHSFGVFKMKMKFSDKRMWFPAYNLTLNPMTPIIYKILRYRKTQNNLRKRGSKDDVL